MDEYNDKNEYSNLDSNYEINTIANKDTINDYEERSMRDEDRSAISYVLKLVIVVFGLFIISLLLGISDRIRGFNQIAGYVSLVIFLILFMYFYIRPIFRIYRMRYFESKGQVKNSRLANKHNERTRRKIAEQIINFNQNVEGANWYDERLVAALKIAVKNNDNKRIYEILTKLMNGSIKNASNKIIVTSAVQSGIYTAMIPSQAIDALLVAGVNLKMIRDILFLYGFRPTNARLVRIFINSIIGSVAAYGLEGSGIGSFLARLGSRAIPVINESSSFLVDAAVQVFTNGTLTMWIGYKAIDYLKKEYKLQVILDDIDVLDDDNEFDNTRKEVVSELKEKVPIIKKTINKIYDENDSNSKNQVVNDSDAIILDYDYKRLIGKNFIDVEKKLLENGFLPENIAFEKEERQKKGILNREGEVISILINGSRDMAKGTKVKKDSKVIIKYAVYGYHSIS